MSRPEAISAMHARRVKLLIVADDLTGTADSAVGCLQRGLKTRIMLSPATPEMMDADAVAIDLDSRHCQSDEAARRHSECLTAWAGCYDHLFKKVDSTLRGNVAAEIASLVPTAGMAIVAPAYPATGRTTRQGHQWLHDRRIEETEVWRNEGIRGRANLREMLVKAGLETRHLSRTDLHDHASAVIQRLRHWQHDGVRAVICDAEVDADLERIAALTATLNKVFWVGAAGLGLALPGALGLAAASAPVIPENEQRQRPTLVVIGSMSPVSHAQADALIASDIPLEVIDINAAALRTTGSFAETERQRMDHRLHHATTGDRSVLTRLMQGIDRDPREGPALSTALGQLLAPHLGAFERLIVTGGATARALLTAAGLDQMILIDAPDTGMARLYARLPDHELEVITKAGGFGDREAFVRLWQHRAASGFPATTSLSRNTEKDPTP